VFAATAALADEAPTPILPVQDAYPHVSHDGRLVSTSTS
jgi:hypothetical protein